MGQQVNLVSIGRNIIVYLLGVGLAIAGALGMAEAIELHVLVSVALLVCGLALVITVHEYFGGLF